MHYTSVVLVATVAILFSSCIEQPNSFTQLPPGEWRGILKLSDPDQVMANSLDEGDRKVKDYFELPFNLRTAYNNEQLEVFLINGEEEIKVESVHFGRDPGTAKDTLQLGLDAFDTKMDGFFEDNFIEGYWIVNYKENYKIPFLASFGQNHRFINRTEEETADFSGRWKVTFEYDNDNAYPAVGEFQQNGNKLSGTFLTETGDYRYLDGNAYGDKLRLSVFDGSHAFLFSGTMEQDTIYGEFRSGKHYKSKWMATKDAEYKLTDPYEMTKTTQSEPINFSFPDPTGEAYALQDNGKIKLINIMGTWCPNCKDEILYLQQLDKKYGDKIDTYTIAFERYRDKEKANKVLKTYKEKLGFDWPILLGGYADKSETTKTFPFLDKIYSYPTLLVLDGENKIRFIHTGFNGPATSKFASFKVEFESKLDQLLAE